MALARLHDGNGGDWTGIYLDRVTDYIEPNVTEVNYEVELVDKDGFSLKRRCNTYYFRKNYDRDSCGFSNIETREKVFNTERELFLPDNTLTIQCEIWKSEKRFLNGKHLYARTVFSTNSRCFTWRIDKFSTVKPGLRKKFKNNFFDLDLVLSEDSDKKLDIDFISFHDTLKYISINTSIINSAGKKDNCGIYKYFVDDLKKGELSPMFNFGKMFRENEGVLSLEFDVVYSTKEEFAPIDKLENLDIDPCDGKEKYEKTAALIDDLKSMFCDAILSDTELRTSTKSFPAHKSILSARSPVFRKMFGNDMKEKNSGHVDIIDMEDDTVHRMLLYIYTDTLEDLQFGNALKLYAAADKYEILSLRKKCSAFLKDGLCPNRACDVLILADLHHDDDLKSAVQSYILEHDEVFKLLEWKHLMDSNLKLAADIMYKKINRDAR